jgi:hypothetical protein
MIDVQPTAAISFGAAVPIAALGRNTFEPGTGMQAIGVGPAASLDVGVLLGRLVLPHVRFERAWATCERQDQPCRAVNDSASFGVRVTSRGRYRVFGDVGIGLRRLTTDPAPQRLQELLFLEYLGKTTNRVPADDASSDIRWTGVDALRLAFGGAYAIRDELAIELQIDCAMGSFRHVETSQGLNANLDPNSPKGYAVDLRDDARKAYVIFGLSLTIRGFLAI